MSQIILIEFRLIIWPVLKIFFLTIDLVTEMFRSLIYIDLFNDRIF